MKDLHKSNFQDNIMNFKEHENIFRNIFFDEYISNMLNENTNNKFFMINIFIADIIKKHFKKICYGRENAKIIKRHIRQYLENEFYPENRVRLKRGRFLGHIYNKFILLKILENENVVVLDKFIRGCSSVTHISMFNDLNNDEITKVINCAKYIKNFKFKFETKINSHTNYIKCLMSEENANLLIKYFPEFALYNIYRIDMSFDQLMRAIYNLNIDFCANDRCNMSEIYGIIRSLFPERINDFIEINPYLIRYATPNTNELNKNNNSHNIQITSYIFRKSDVPIYFSKTSTQTYTNCLFIF